MPGKAAVTVALQPDGDAAPTAPPKSCPFVLKKVMDIPPPNILEEGDDGKGAPRRTARAFGSPPRVLAAEALGARGRLNPQELLPGSAC